MASPAALVETWSSFYANSAIVRSLVGFAHVGGLLGGGGCAIAADLATLRATGGSVDVHARRIDAIHSAHRLVVAGLIVVAVSGVLLTMADLEAYLSAPAFWVKMALVFALALNGAALIRITDRARPVDGTAQAAVMRSARVSLILWFATTLLGAVLPNAL